MNKKYLILVFVFMFVAGGLAFARPMMAEAALNTAMSETVTAVNDQGTRINCSTKGSGWCKNFGSGYYCDPNTGDCRLSRPMLKIAPNTINLLVENVMGIPAKIEIKSSTGETFPPASITFVQTATVGTYKSFNVMVKGVSADEQTLAIKVLDAKGKNILLREVNVFVPKAPMVTVDRDAEVKAVISSIARSINQLSVKNNSVGFWGRLTGKQGIVKADFDALKTQLQKVLASWNGSTEISNKRDCEDRLIIAGEPWEQIARICGGITD